MGSQATILVIDDEEIIREVLVRLLEDRGYRVLVARTGEEGLQILEQDLVDLVLLDMMLPGIGGLNALEKILKGDPNIVVIMITAYASIENAVKATRLGAFDFITKPFKNDELLLVVKNGLEKKRLQEENQRLKQSFRSEYSFERIVGKSPQMQQVFQMITQVGPRRTTVLICGESGTGKELVAKAIHNCSSRAEGPFVPVNSGTIPTDLLESELFGHVKGAFTGATSSKKGLFELADGGTLFLDEVGTIPHDTQAKLLRVIQEREFRRVGGLENIKVDVRIIAASNIDLKKAVENGQFRDDLYYRLNVISLWLPPLRQRKDDIPLLVDHFVRRYCEENERSLCRVQSEAMHFLMEYEWPGNVRELENVIERAVVLAGDDNLIDKSLFPQDLVLNPPGENGDLASEGEVSLKERVSEFERNLITTALKRSDWNQKKAAEMLQVNPTTLNEKLKRLKIKIP